MFHVAEEGQTLEKIVALFDGCPMEWTCFWDIDPLKNMFNQICGPGCVGRMKHMLMHVGMSLRLEADFVVCIIFWRAQWTSRCVPTPLWRPVNSPLCWFSFSRSLQNCSRKSALKVKHIFVRFRLQTGHWKHADCCQRALHRLLTSCGFQNPWGHHGEQDQGQTELPLDPWFH